MTTSTGTTATATLRHPRVEDGASMWQMAKDSGGLDMNSPYCYLLMCTHFAQTCLMAEMEGEPVGFVTAYRPPTHPDTIFVWQIAVAAQARRTGLARRMVNGVLQSPACSSVRLLEATVTESNVASEGLFRSIAEQMGANFDRSTIFAAKDFPESSQDSPHEAELLLRIGPFDL
ncbi:MAG: diaminobutyrate acetyltransferase [Actinobacteria bacterium]|nr:diaminobutyrate acetyltransferase [Actinomycetota bacterium]